MMREYKVIKTVHKYSPLENKVAYAIIVTTHLVAEADAKRGICLDNPEDLFIIATDITDATNILINHAHTADVNMKDECDLNAFESQSSEY